MVSKNIHSCGSIERYATVEAECEGVPVYAFGYTYVYGVSPDFLPDVIWQVGNHNPRAKIRPKKSWEIKGNKLGSTPAREPKTTANDDQPLLPVHLIDGDPRTCWCSRGQVQPDVEDVWIRIDLPVVSRVKSVALLQHQEGLQGLSPSPWPSLWGGIRPGQALPKQLLIKVSRDGWHWETVCENRNLAPPKDHSPLEIEFDTRETKQVWVIGREVPPVLNFGHCFSIGGVEVRDENGENLALHSRGAGVTVSSTHLGYGMDRFTQDMLWPIQYDLGFKWSRVGYDMGMFTWAYVEREKGNLVVDPKAEAALTEAVNNGIEFILCLDKGNWLYADPPRQQDRTRQLMETYYNNAPWPHSSERMLEGYLNYVRFMVRRFKDQVRYYEVWNEWQAFINTVESARGYCKVARPAIQVIREEYPDAKIALAAFGGWPPIPPFLPVCLEEGLIPLVDVISFHPWYQANPESKSFRDYAKDLQELKRTCESYGFKGEYMATEWTWSAPYPPAFTPNRPDLPVVSEMQKAKYAARLTLTHVALDVTSFWNETFQTQFTSWDVSLLRNTFSADPIVPTQPQPVYYVLRTLSTVLEDVKPCEMPVEFAGEHKELEWYTFERGDRERLVAVWVPGAAVDGVAEGKADVKVAGEFWRAIAVDVLNGTEQELKVSHQGTSTVLEGMLIKDFPVVIRLER